MKFLKAGLIGGAALFAASANANLLTNGSFEDLQIGSAWTYYQGAATSQVAGWDSDRIEIHNTNNGSIGSIGTAQEGNQYLELNAHPYTGAAFTLKQDFATVAGQTYDVSFYFAARNGSELFTVDVNDAENAGVSLTGSSLVTNSLTTEWSLFTTSFVAASTTSSISFATIFPLAGTEGNYIDNVSVVAAVPEAGSLALFGLGLAGLGLTRRRQK